MKFYDMEALAKRSGTDNKYDITARIAARARWLGEHRSLDTDEHERFLSEALAEVEQSNSIPAPGDAPIKLYDNGSAADDMPAAGENERDRNKGKEKGKAKEKEKEKGREKEKDRGKAEEKENGGE